MVCFSDQCREMYANYQRVDTGEDYIGYSSIFSTPAKVQQNQGPYLDVKTEHLIKDA